MWVVKFFNGRLMRYMVWEVRAKDEQEAYDKWCKQFDTRFEHRIIEIKQMM